MAMVLQLLGSIVLIGIVGAGTWFFVSNTSLKKESSKISEEKGE